MRRPAPGRPDQRPCLGHDTQVEASGDRRVDDLAGDRLEHRASLVGLQHAPERRQRVLGNGVAVAAALGGLGPPVRMLGEALRLASRLRRSSGSA
ncbi:hypothetical protein [Methylorubrum aminovorans]|uniref:hypothetical protein n=1 Tax=Methylorubrum aminovorans TaxID=269069 RepID=UPI0032AF2372